jgi:transcriptional regulator CtsR
MINNFDLQIKIDKIENKLNNIEELLNKLLEKKFSNSNNQYLNNSIFEDNILTNNNEILFKSIPNMPMLKRMHAFNKEDYFENSLNSLNSLNNSINF